MNWTSIKNKIPEADGRYLVCEKMSGGYKWVGVSSLRHGKWDCSMTTHWMELPAPPVEIVVKKKRAVKK